ncbi:MAG: hypothetical protein QFC55_04850 [Chloroflexota bacterium]|nr:hypothetical protein [Chloroflexota bacterium]
MTHSSGAPNAGERPTDPPYRLIVWPFLRRLGARLIMPSWLAITIGCWIFAWRPLDAAELAHELAHVRQWRANGLRFIPRYLGESRRAAAGGGDRYRDNRFEVEARAAAESVLRSAAN